MGERVKKERPVGDMHAAGRNLDVGSSRSCPNVSARADADMPLFPTSNPGGKAGRCQDKPGNTVCLTCILDDSPFFEGLSLDAKLTLQEHLFPESIARRKVLYSQGDPNDRLYILLSGKIKLYKTLSCGRQQIYKLVVIPGDLIACDDLFLDQHISSAQAITDVKICSIKKSALFFCIKVHPEIINPLLQTFARNVNTYIQQVANLGPKNALERIACYLIFLYETHQERKISKPTVRNSLTRTELADMLGITQRTLIRGLKELEARGSILITHHGFMILDLPELMQLANI